MKILGLSEGRNGTAAVMIDGKIVACASEERFSGLKNDDCYPKKAIEFCLEFAKIKPSDLDYVALATTGIDLCWDGIRNEALMSVADHVFEQHQYYKKLLIDGKSNEEVMPEYLKGYLERKGPFKSYYDIANVPIPELLKTEVTQEIRKKNLIGHLGIPESKIRFFDHHECHTYYAYFTSPYRDDNTLIATMDSSGDRGINATLSIANKKGIKKIFETDNCQLGRIYKYITLLLGMKPQEHEYKVMGLAPYGNIKEVAKSYTVFKDILKVNGLEFEWVNRPKDLYFSFRERLEGHRFDGIAGGLQKFFEELVTEWIKNVLTKTKSKILVFAGGSAMNIKLNMILSKLPELNKFYVGANPCDESNAIGACCYQYYQYLQSSGLPFKNVYPVDDVYLGMEFDYQGFLNLAKNDKSGKYKIIPNMNDKKIAKMLAEGKIIARCMGRMEFGARALGNRSIMADGSRTDSVRKINFQIKHRDFWMPFAPSIMEDKADKYLFNKKKLRADYMTLGFETKPLAHKHLIAALHPEDLTARPQIVRKAQNPQYYNLLKEFYKLTGMGGILNTSFNLHGHPIVSSPESAMMVMEKSDLEYIYVKDNLVQKKL